MRIYRLNKYWALSSFGRAPSLHLGGERFDPLGSTEQKKNRTVAVFLVYVEGGELLHEYMKSRVRVVKILKRRLKNYS